MELENSLSSRSDVRLTFKDNSETIERAGAGTETRGMVTIDPGKRMTRVDVPGVPAPPQPRPTLTVIIPTLNESGNLPYVLNTIPTWVDEVLIVDGRSKDDTLRIAKVLQPDVRIVNETMPGKGQAVRTGFQAAKGDFIVVLDADGSMDGAKIPDFYEAMRKGADYVKGSRFAKGGGSADITRLRRFGDKGICVLIWLLFGARYSDATYGFIGVQASAVPKIDVDTPGFEVETLIGIRAQRAGLKVVEVPCFESKRIHGTSNLHALRDGMRIFSIIIRERLRRYSHESS